MYLSLLLSVNIIHLSSAKHDIRMKHDGSESKEIDGANLSRSFLDPPPFEGTCATLRYRGFQQQYQVEQSVGYCTPWGTGGGGDLCCSLDKFNQEPQHVQDEAKDACSDVDSKYYHNNCDHVCIEKKCSFLAGDICKGYTWNKSVNKG